MRRFLAYLSEAIEVKQLKHLTHVEDHAILHGKEGFDHAAKTLQSVHNSLTGHGDTHGVKVTEKFDGAPSLVFGHDPKTKKFFVASKSAFNKNPKINYSEKDVDANHGNAPGLAEKLKNALKHLKHVAPKEGVYQGDLMYTKGDVQSAGGQYHFTPNTVTHSVDKGTDEGRKVGRSDLGIVVHTKYEGDDLSNMQAGFDVDHHAFKPHPKVHVINPEMHFNGVYTPTQQQMFQMHMRKAQAHNNAIGNNHHVFNGHEDHLGMYINDTVRSSSKPSLQGYKNFLAGRKAKDVASVKTDKAKQIKTKHHEELAAHVDKHSAHFENLLAAHGHLQKAKQQLIDALSTNKRGINYTIKGEPSRPEGFVAILKNKAGESLPSKLVSREPTGFAAMNLQGAGKFQKAKKK